MTRLATSTAISRELIFEPNDNLRLAALGGQCDQNLRQLEQRFQVEIYNRGSHFTIYGDSTSVDAVARALTFLYQQTRKGGEVSPATMQTLLQPKKQGQMEREFVEENAGQKNQVMIRTKNLLVKPKGAKQLQYVQNIQEYDISFGVGPAGTGKTYLAVACAASALERGDVERIILVRPAVEAGERIGFLPGDIAQKVDPFLRPIYDALYDMLGFHQTQKLIEKNIIEIAPLAFMRGRTLNNAFILLDESQNTTVEQMKMFLTRLGFNSKVVVTGDVTQTDLPKHRMSGLQHAIEVLREVGSVSFTFFQNQDVVRHHLVQQVLEAYQRYEECTV